MAFSSHMSYDTSTATFLSVGCKPQRLSISSCCGLLTNVFKSVTDSVPVPKIPSAVHIVSFTWSRLCNEVKMHFDVLAVFLEKLTAHWSLN